MPPSRSIYPRDTSDSTILLPVLLPLLLVPILAALILFLAKGSKSNQTDQRSRQPTIWPVSSYWEQMPLFTNWFKSRERGPPVPGRDYCPGIGRGLRGFSGGRMALPWTRRVYSGYGDMPPPSRTRNRGRIRGRASREPYRGHLGRRLPPALEGLPGLGSGANLAALQKQSPFLGRRRWSPRYARSDSSFTSNSTESSRGPFQSHAMAPVVHRRPNDRPYGYGGRAAYPPAHLRSAGMAHRGLAARAPNRYVHRPSFRRQMQPYDRYRGTMGRHGTPYSEPRYPTNVHDGGYPIGDSEFDSSEDDYSESGFLSHSSSPYTGPFGESGSDSDPYDRRYNGRGGRVGGPNPRDPYRTGRGSDGSTYSEGYAGHRRESSDAYNSPRY
ncbi:MAG: hypothetical protein M1836_005129 [Candelina mexicana]|nr:MAG: hypothetical protein M1836_005129 [Candelina mexicana]